MPKTWYCSAPTRAGNCTTNPSSVGSRLRSAAFALLAAFGLSAAAQAQYCTATATFCEQAFGDERISHVSIADIDNDSGDGDGPGGCYSDFTSITGHLVPGNSYIITVTNAGPFNGDWCACWVDFNNDLTFDTTTEQFVLTTADYATFTGSITVPPTASGPSRLRVRLCLTSGRAPCGNAAYGEVEDYAIQIASSTTGACCAASGACTQTASGACSGTFQGLSSACSPNPCGGACCTGPTCTVTTAASCPSGSVYINHAVCSAASCTYCTAGSATCGTADNDERISHVSFNTIDNDSGTGDGPAGCYTDFTSVSTIVYPGQTYPITILNATGGEWPEDQCAVWIDFNGDYAFGDAASGEQVVLTSADDGATFTGSVTVPVTARLGLTRMRVRVCYDTGLVACGNAGFGEVEDYSINIQVATTGACCQASGACTESLPGACVGAFNGVATSCAPSNPCGGACCDTAGNCTVTIAGACTGTSVFTNNGVCSPTYCSGSCCSSNGACSIAPAASGCTGIFSGVHTTCAPNPCIGACCNPVDGTCAVSALTGCASGTYQSAGTSCTPNNCPQPPAPANDSCSAAQAIIVNAPAISGTTLGATPDYAVVPNDWCTVSEFDVYYSFVAPAAGGYGISMTNESLLSIVVLSACGDTVNLGCSGIDFDNALPLVTVPSAGTYLIRVAHYEGDAGNFSIEIHSVDTTPPANDDCAAAAIATLGNNAGSNVFATESVSLNNTADALCNQATWQTGTPNNQKDVFWKFTAPATADYEINTCGSAIDTIMSIHSACPVDQTNLITCNDDSTVGTGNTSCATVGGGIANNSRIPHVTLTAGTSYYIRVFGWNNNTGTLALNINTVSTTGSCCVGSVCTLTDAANCSGTYSDGGSCSSNPCTVGGVCCRGSTCNTTFASAAACAAAVDTVAPATVLSKFVPATAACNTPVTNPGTLGNTTSPCCYANYNHNATLEVQDIFDFLNDWFAGKKAAIVGGNGSSGTLQVQNIFDFLNSWFAGGCN